MYRFIDLRKLDGKVFQLCPRFEEGFMNSDGFGCKNVEIQVEQWDFMN